MRWGGFWYAGNGRKVGGGIVGDFDTRVLNYMA